MDAILVSVIVIAVVLDLRSRRIPNILTVTSSLIGIIMLSLEGKAVISIAGLILGIALMMPGFMIGGVGGGDVKLMAAIGSLKGPSFVLNVFIISTLCGGLLALICAIKDGRLQRLLIDTWDYIKSLGVSIITGKNLINVTLPNAEEASVIPYGVAIFSGTVIVLLGMGWSFI